MTASKAIVEQRDYTDRRHHVALVTARLIFERGIDGVRVRDVAALAGYSTHIVSHYFENKNELMLFTLRQCAARQVRRLKMAISRNCTISECLETLLPLDEERLIDSRVWMVFWTQTLNDPEIAAVQREFGAKWRRLLVGMMRIRDYFTPDVSRQQRDFLAQELQVAVAGIGVHGALGVWDADQQRQHLHRQVETSLAGLVQPAEILPLKAISTEGVSGAAANNSGEQQLAVENARLRKMLVDAMLQIETLTEAMQGAAQGATLLKSAEREA